MRPTKQGGVEVKKPRWSHLGGGGDMRVNLNMSRSTFARRELVDGIVLMDFYKTDYWAGISETECPF